MAAAVQITFRDMTPSDAVSEHVGRRADKLGTFFQRMVKCHVVVEEPHRHSRHGKKFQVEIGMHVPGRELVVSKTPDDGKENMHVAIDRAFDDAERMLEDYASQLRPSSKQHHKDPHGKITKLFVDRGYGFIEDDVSGEEVYFHRNSVLGEKFEKLTLGSKVRFAEELGDKGPQASTVHVVRLGHVDHDVS